MQTRLDRRDFVRAALIAGVGMTSCGRLSAHDVLRDEDIVRLLVGHGLDERDASEYVSLAREYVDAHDVGCDCTDCQFDLLHDPEMHIRVDRSTRRFLAGDREEIANLAAMWCERHRAIRECEARQTFRDAAT